MQDCMTKYTLLYKIYPLLPPEGQLPSVSKLSGGNYLPSGNEIFIK